MQLAYFTSGRKLEHRMEKPISLKYRLAYIFAIVLDYAMRRAIDGREEELGFKVDRRRSRRHHPVVIADTDFADDIGITTEEIHQTQEMLASVELEAAKSDFILILRRRK